MDLERGFTSKYYLSNFPTWMSSSVYIYLHSFPSLYVFQESSKPPLSGGIQKRDSKFSPTKMVKKDGRREESQKYFPVAGSWKARVEHAK